MEPKLQPDESGFYWLHRPDAPDRGQWVVVEFNKDGKDVFFPGDEYEAKLHTFQVGRDLWYGPLTHPHSPFLKTGA